MTLLDFVKLLLSYKKWLLTLPFVVAGAVLVLTLSQPKTYVSQALLYTGIVPTSDGTVNVQARVDVFAVNNAIDNIQTIITSRQVLEEASLHVIARHLSRSKANPKKLEKSITKFMETYGEELKALPSDESEELVFKALAQQSQTPLLRWLTEDEKSIYSIDKIKEGLKIKRSGSSDLLEVIYTADEASVARETLQFLIDAFTKRFKEIRKSEVGSMVSFFEKEVSKAGERLAKCAEDMKLFQVRNRIINYYEQTHLVAIETEHLNGQYYDELMKLAASERAYQDLRSKLGDPFQQALSSGEIVHSQQLISQLMTKKQLVSSSSMDYKIINDSIQKTEIALRKAINQLYVDGRTEEGVSKKDVLRQWLDQFIALSEAQARVVVMESRKTKQESEYDFFAPLGSMLHNFERQMDVSEREYLDLLHSLNQARLRQQSAETSTTLATVDAPSAPIKPEQSKRKLLVIIGWLGTVIIIIGVALFIEYFDSTLQSPERAESKTGLAVLGSLTNDSTSAIGKMTIANLILGLHANIPKAADKTRKILVISKLSNKQSIEIGLQLARILTDQGEKIALGGSVAKSQTDFPVASTDEWIKESSEFDTIIGILPSLNQASSEWNLLEGAHETLLVVSADQTWTSSDVQSAALLEKISKRKPLLVLVGVNEQRLEHWLGELPKKRSRIRRLIKRVIRFQFN